MMMLVKLCAAGGSCWFVWFGRERVCQSNIERVSCWYEGPTLLGDSSSCSSCSSSSCALSILAFYTSKERERDTTHLNPLVSSTTGATTQAEQSKKRERTQTPLTRARGHGPWVERSARSSARPRTLVTEPAPPCQTDCRSGFCSCQ